MKPGSGLQLSCLLLLLAATFGLLVTGIIDSVQFYLVILVFVMPACIGGLGVEDTGSRKSRYHRKKICIFEKKLASNYFNLFIFEKTFFFFTKMQI